VIQENLRSMCVWQYTQSLNESLWWDYSNLWNKNCFMTSDMAKTFTDTCSYNQMTTLDSKMATYVKNCITSSGGYEYTSGVNTILDSETKIREKKLYLYLPNYYVKRCDCLRKY